MAKPRSPGLALRAYGMLARGLGVLAPWHLRRRLAKGREDAMRWREKLGEAGAARPEGRLIWLHGVGVGEVMALRGLIAAMGRLEPHAQFLLTSSARSSAQVVGANLPPRTIHQYLPLDAPAFVTRFLDHWQPDLAIWSDQEVWPCAVLAADRRGVPLAFVNARITPESLGKRRFIKALYGDVLKRFQLIAAQDQRSADALAALGAPLVVVNASLKASAPLLQADIRALARMQVMFAGRLVWVAASTHPEDEAVALAAQAALYARDPRWLLILVPRDPARAPSVTAAITLSFAQRSKGEDAGARAVYLADTFGELGLWYRLARAALIGGSFSAVEGHNPWEAAVLGCAVLHGPRVANFAQDCKRLHAESVATQVDGAEDLLAALLGDDLERMSQRGTEVWQRNTPPEALAAQLLGLMR